MENASKALLIAAAILIAIILIGIGVFVVNQGVGRAKKYANMDSQDVLAFNSEFESYVGNNIRGSSVKSLATTVSNHNRTAEDESLKVKLNNTETPDPSVFLSGKIYKVEAVYDKGGLLTEINATEVP